MAETNLRNQIREKMVIEPIPFSKFDPAQVVNAMMRAMEKTRFWTNMLKEWANTPWNIREEDVKLTIQMAWKFGKTETANICAEREGKIVVLKVYVKRSVELIEEVFYILMEEN